MTTADSLSITRLGDTIPVPAFWATLSVMFPEEYDLFEAIDSLSTMKPMVHYGEVNGFIRAASVPDDPIYTPLNLQHGLQSTIYPNAHINIEPAWTIETGSSEIVVGVFDSPIYWSHPDFYVDNNFPSGSYEGSKIIDGWDYVTDIPINQISSPWDSHGTSVAGIIGSVRNNAEGVAGIAGGDFSVANPNATNGGVTLISFGILSEPPFTFPPPPAQLLLLGLTTSAIEAEINGAILSASGTYGLGVNVQNHSWQTTANVLEILANNNQINHPLALKDAIHHAWENSSIVVAARGNMNSTGGAASNGPAYPSCYDDIELLNVGASGIDGQRKNLTNGDFSLGDWSSMYGSGMDFLAPGVTELIAAPYVQNDNPFPWFNLPLQDAFPSGYTAFNGTSAAAPIVSGVAALMLSKHNINNGAPNNLATEDVEHILQKTTNVSQQFILDFPNEPLSLAHTESEGFGLINAGLALQQVDYPNYFVQHFSNVSGAKNVSAPTQKIVTLATGNAFDVQPGTYVANEYLVTWNFNITLDNNHEIIDFWPLLVKSFPGFLVSMNTINTDELLQFPEVTPTINGNNITFTVQSYAYLLLWLEDDPFTPINHHLPYHPFGADKMDYAFSLHIRLNEELSITQNSLNQIKAFPNPTSDILTLDCGDISIQNIQIIDASGRVIQQLNEVASDNNRVEITHLQGLSTGLYFIKVLSTEEESFTIKIVKK